MMTKIELLGPLGKRFGKHWTLDVESPREAIDMIDANCPGMKSWMKQNAAKYANYRVVITDMDGKKRTLDEEAYVTAGIARKITFLPLVRGASSGPVRIVIGVVLIVAGIMTSNPALIGMGIGMALGGIIQMLSPQPKTGDGKERSDKTSYYFNGPVNTNNQGVPVPLIYGRCLVGSQAISASISIDQELSE